MPEPFGSFGWMCRFQDGIRARQQTEPLVRLTYRIATVQLILLPTIRE